MALQLFRVAGGMSDGRVHYLSGSGVPGGDGAYQDNAPVGSQYLDNGAGEQYLKVMAGAGNDKWRRQATKQDIDAITAGTSWREPARVRDTLNLDVASAEADLNADDTLDGVTIQAGDRILFAEFSSHPNVYIVSGSSGSWTISEDPNEETAGDALMVLEGTDAGKKYWYNGTDWIWFGEETSSEDQFIRDFIGKGAVGGVLPSYTSNNYVANNDNLAAAIGKLDEALGLVEGTTSDIQAELDQVESSVGLNPDGTFAGFTGSNFLDASTSVVDALLALDSAISSSDALANTSATNVTTEATIDEVDSTTVKYAKWFVHITEAGTPANKRAVEVYAVHNGAAGAGDATDADYSVYSVLAMGSAISGLQISVDVSGAGAAQKMRLRVESTASVNVVANRLNLQ